MSCTKFPSLIRDLANNLDVLVDIFSNVLRFENDCFISSFHVWNECMTVTSLV